VRGPRGLWLGGFCAARRLCSAGAVGEPGAPGVRTAGSGAALGCGGVGVIWGCAGGRRGGEAGGWHWWWPGAAAASQPDGAVRPGSALGFAPARCGPALLRGWGALVESLAVVMTFRRI